ncbi:hypothetical protein BTH42_09660 [Burkholderia sp. SRS-W-2-2016]|uniref:hypothetical protein n=1 Tax=Burkholderia sp. SRS-W-2-2016 TaxID=1926878 RepID=UPI00094ACF89|nr:hypothetical protein [Burkholderia sp. SRS-W-2-2016]OLL31999.1 hypothetical protein BTH42_09660 [Burkholderia sp. SRS-W-2-2016]
MNIRYLGILSATAAVVLLSFSGAVQAGGGRGGDGGGTCSTATLNGAYGFIGHGEILGLLDPSNMLHPFTTPSILDDVALISFDGKGTFTRTDFGSINGVPKGGDTGFNPFQSGTYTVNADCTGTMSVVYTAGGSVPANVETDLNIVIVDDGTQIESVVYRASVPFAQSAPGYSCSMNCVQGVQESFEGKKVSVHGFR